MDYSQREAGYSNFSGTNSVINQDISKGNERGLFRAKDKSTRAVIQVLIENFSADEQVYELFNSNNSIAIQPADDLYSTVLNPPTPYKPADAAFVASLVNDQAGITPTGAMPEPVAVFGRKGSLLYISNDNTTVSSPNGTTLQQYVNAVNEVPIVGAPVGTVLKQRISLKSTLRGNAYKRLIEKMRTSVIHVQDWKIQCTNEAQFQLSIAQKDFTITGASADDEMQISSSVSSKDNNTKIVEISDKMLLIDGDTRLSGIILPQTTMVFTFDVDVINEVTKRVF